MSISAGRARAEAPGEGGQGSGAAGVGGASAAEGGHRRRVDFSPSRSPRRRVRPNTLLTSLAARLPRRWQCKHG